MSESDAQPRRNETDPDEDRLDLTDLDKDGIEGVLGRMRAASSGDGDDLPLEPPPRPRRSPALSVVVVIAGLFWLVWAWPDFHYWIQPSEPRDLGHASELVQAGKMPDDLHDAFVVVEGTPDTQFAALATRKNGDLVGYLRLTEGGGQLFAAVPRSREEKTLSKIEARFRGRMQRLGRDEAFAWLQQLYRDWGVVRVIDSSVDALTSALSRGPLAEIETVEGNHTIGPDDAVRLVGRMPEVRLQLGVTTYPSAAAAEKAVAALGYPFVATASHPNYHSFVARIPEGERERVDAELDAGVPQGANLADPKVGGALLPVTASHRVRPTDLALAGDDLVFPRGDNTAASGWDVVDGKLVERGEADGNVTLPRSAVRAVRIEEPIEVDPDGYVVVVGTEPADKRWFGVAWLAVVFLVLVNASSLFLWSRRRQPGRAG